MLLVAQRVVSPKRVQGVNAFRYLHGDSPWPEDATSMLDERGLLAWEHLEVRPGGNYVQSYLDIAAPDDVTPEALRDSLFHFVSQAERPLEAVYFPDTRVALRFNLNLGIADRWKAEFLSLVERLLGAPRAPQSGDRVA